MGCPSLPRPPTANSVSTRRPGHSGILGLEGSQDGHPVGPGMGGGLGQCHRANWKQYRELSSGPDPEPCALPVPHCLGARPRDPPVFQVPVFPSVTAVVIPGHGDKPLFPSQVPLSLPLPRPARRFSCCVLLLHPGGQGCLYAGLASPRVLHCCGEVLGAQGSLHAWFRCAEPCRVMFLIGVLEPVGYLRTGLVGYAQTSCQQAGTRLRVGQSVSFSSLPTCHEGGSCILKVASSMRPCES